MRFFVIAPHVIFHPSLAKKAPRPREGGVAFAASNAGNDARGPPCSKAATFHVDQKSSPPYEGGVAFPASFLPGMTGWFSTHECS